MRTVVVLGMHKSGTSLVAETLHHSGIAMVEALRDGGYDEGEKYERAETRAINKALLDAEGVYSLDVRTQLDPGAADPALVERARALVASMEARGEDWGFKDPRTCMTWSFWEPLLREPLLVCVFRDAGEVHRRYRSKPLFSAFRSMDAWYRYNDAMRRAYLAAPAERRLMIDYRELMRGETDWSALSRLAGRPLGDRRDPAMRRHVARVDARGWWDALRYRLRSGNSVRSLSRELRRLARSSPR